MRKYVQRSILKGETRPSHKLVSPTLVCATPIQIVANNAIIPTFNFDNAPPAFTLILEEDSFGFIQSHSIIINNANVAHIKFKIESVIKLNNGQAEPVFSVDTVSAFITISAPNASFLRVLPFDGADYEESAHVHLGLISDPDPRGTAYASDFNLRSATSLDNKTSVLTSYIAPYEDRTSESVNRAIDSVANNTENVYLDVSDSYYKVVQVKINTDIGNDELISFIQDSNFTSDAIVPIMRNIPNIPWVRSIKQDVLEDQLNSFPSGQSNLDIIAYATNKPIYVASRFENRTDITRTANFREIYLASRERAETVQNGVDSYAGFSQCTNSTKIITNNDILLGNESSYESYIKSGKIDDLFGSEKIISNPGTFWIASADITQQQLDTCFIKVQDQLKANNVNVGDEFNDVSKRGYVSFPGTLYGTKAMTGSFKCIDRGTIRYVQADQEKLPIFISEGMLVTNGFDAYEIEQVVDQKTLLLKPVSNYEDILLGDVSLLQRVELRPDIIQDFDIYFGKYISKTQIAIFATRPISVESIISSQRENNDLQSRQIYLDLGLLVKLHDSRIGTSVMDNQDDNFMSEENISNIDKRLALFNKFARSVIGVGLTADNGVSPISLESLASNASDTRSPFKSSSHYVSQPLTPDIQDEGYITVPQVLALNFLRKNSTRKSFISATQLNYALKTFESKLVKGIKQFCDWCFLGYTNIVGGFDRFVWSDLINKIETRSLEAVLQEMLSSKLHLILDLDIQQISQDSVAFKEFTSLVYSALKYYGYISNLSTIPLNQFDITAPENKIQVALFNDIKTQYIDAMSQFGNAKYLGGNIFRLQANDETIDEFFSIEDIGKPFTLSYLHVSANDVVIPYVKQIRVFMDEWYNGSCVRLSFDGMHHNEVDGILNNPCFIGYAPGDVEEIADITEVLQRGSSKAKIIDTFSVDMTLSRMFSTSFRAANTYFMERSFSNLVVSDEYTYVFMPGINAFENDCEALTVLPKFIGSHINLDLATMTYDLAQTPDLIPANVTLSEDFLNNFIKPFFDTEIILQNNGSVVRITPKQNIGVSSVYLDIKMANPMGQTINRLVECTKTCIAYDGTIVLRVDTLALMTNSDRDLFLARSPINIGITQRIDTSAQFNGINTNRFEINYVGGVNDIAQWYVDTMPMRRNLLAQSNLYAVTTWFTDRNIVVINHKQQASVNIHSIANIQQSDVNSKVIVDNQYIQKKALDSKISVDIRPNPTSFKVNEANKHIEIESFNDSTAISILQKTSISQGRNRVVFQDQRGQDNDINSAIQITTEPRSFNDQLLEVIDNHPTLKIGEQIPALLYKKRQAGIHATSISSSDSITPAVLGVINDNSSVPETPEADNFSIGAITAINKLDNQVFAQSTTRPMSASLQANQNVVIDDSVIYEGSDNVLSGNARTNWKGTGFKRLGGRATSLNTITSARQIDANTPSGNSNSYQSPHHKIINKKIFRYVDSYSKVGSSKGRGFSSENVAMLNGRSTIFKDVNNIGLTYETLPNYIGENDVLFTFTFNGLFSYSPDNIDTGSFSISGIFSNIGSDYTFSRLADSNRLVSIRAKFGSGSPLYFTDLGSTGFATGKLPNASSSGDLDWLPESLYADGFLVDSLITDEMIEVYKDRFNYVSNNAAHDALVNHALGIDNDDQQQNWLESVTEVEVILHGREWNANLHSLVVSGGLSIGNNLRDKTLSIILDQKRESALLTIPNGGLNIDAQEIYLGSDSITGPGAIRLQKQISSTQDIELGVSREVGLMMLPIRPKITTGSIANLTQQQVRSSNTKIFASLYFVSESAVDTYSVPFAMDFPNESHASKYTYSPTLNSAQIDLITSERKNILDFQTVSTSARIIGATIEYSRDLLTHDPVTSDIIERINPYNETNVAIPRDELNVEELQTKFAIGKKYLVMDLADYLTHEKDATIEYLKSYTTFDIASNTQIITSEVMASIKNDAANSHQTELNLAFSSGGANLKINYDRLSNTNPSPAGVIRAFSTADGAQNNDDYSFTKPLNISKLEASSLNGSSGIPTTFFTQDYLRQSPRYSDSNDIFYVKKLKTAGDMTSTTVVTRYNARAYIRPVLFNGKWDYVMEIPFKDIIVTIRLDSVIVDGFLYPCIDYKLVGNDVYQAIGNIPTMLQNYKRDCINNLVNADRLDDMDVKVFFTRPCITWVSAHVEFSTQGLSFGDIVSVQIQPAHYMPTWIDRAYIVYNETNNTSSRLGNTQAPNTTTYYYLNWHNKHQMAAAYNFQDIMKILRASSEIVIKTSDGKSLNSSGLTVGDSASTATVGYNGGFGGDYVLQPNTDGFLNENAQVWNFPTTEIRYRETVLNFVGHMLGLNLIIHNEDIALGSVEGAQQLVGYKKSIISVQNGGLKKIINSVGEPAIIECENVSRAYYNIINRLDFLNGQSLDKLGTDGEFAGINSVTILEEEGFTDWLIGTNRLYTISDLTRHDGNIGSFIKAFLVLGVDVCRIHRVRNAGFELPTQTITLNQLQDPIVEVLLRDKNTEYVPNDTYDPRQYGVFSKLAIPHVIKFTRK